MTLKFVGVDSHCHLDFSDFDVDRNEVMQRAQKQGVQAFVVPGVHTQQWQQLKRLVLEYPQWVIGFGLHPYFISQHLAEKSIDAQLAQLETLLKSHPDVFVGEIGLDANQGQLEIQHNLLHQQLALAVRYQRPVVLHHYKTQVQLLASIKQANQEAKKQGLPALRGMLHAFSGSYEQGMEWVRLGFYLGVGGTITYERAKKTRSAISRLPLEALLLETDSPDMPLAGRQGQRNEPSYLVDTFQHLCQLRAEPREQIQTQLLSNTQGLFSFSIP